MIGPVLQPGDKASEVTLSSKGFDGTARLLESMAGKIRLINVIPSIGTGICDAQTRRFNEEAATFGDGVVVVTVSADLPFHLAEWCAAKGVDRIVMMSDHLDMAFGDAYGTHIKELRLEQRSVFVVDARRYRALRRVRAADRPASQLRRRFGGRQVVVGPVSLTSMLAGRRRLGLRPA